MRPKSITSSGNTQCEHWYRLLVCNVVVVVIYFCCYSECEIHAVHSQAHRPAEFNSLLHFNKSSVQTSEVTLFYFSLHYLYHTHTCVQEHMRRFVESGIVLHKDIVPVLLVS